MTGNERQPGETSDGYAHRMIDQCRHLLGVAPSGRVDRPQIVDNRGKS